MLFSRALQDAANGVVHSETPSKDMMEKGGTMEGFQM